MLSPARGVKLFLTGPLGSAPGWPGALWGGETEHQLGV